MDRNDFDSLNYQKQYNNNDNKTKIRKQKSCGAVVYKMENGKPFFLIEHMVKGHISLPKGHVKKNETEVDTALREIKEETNLMVDLDTGFRHTIGYSPKKNVYKDVVFFIAEAKEGEMKNQESEVTSLEWLPFQQALEALTYEDDKDVLDKAMKYLTEKTGKNS
ncbi:NUDIX hydrolase domain-like protein [Neocallimastix lanati (nom. inval.)]|jgi:8-oxo-dGTP pyrophosphatase MutT (NUDIX family)|uniref:Bis(5'-nucleosyl)-tetraphosphatase [asymmetrical] n=1 Tax=Neocallimastix californiae TaxID=1754190 RepID=A0A1Y1ZEL3_9FUNG|nr:NUDIX hydrolase domain-like protein [Neocallimastix sp. JGI-2020a]ORY08681.1 hypothetical protein LY90DRAFT_709061 [Neocallimastix californiae]|eukprot:ORY08681.1 hypothetical protein LY90DRAFT_709061 [Neocallimastix californiae]